MLGRAVFQLGFGGHQPGHGLEHDIVTGAVGVGALAAKGGVFAVDKLGVQRGQGPVVDPQAGRHVGAVVDQHHVGLGDEFA